MVGMPMVGGLQMPMGGAMGALPVMGGGYAAAAAAAASAAAALGAPAASAVAAYTANYRYSPY